MIDAIHEKYDAASERIWSFHVLHSSCLSHDLSASPPHTNMIMIGTADKYSKIVEF